MCKQSSRFLPRLIATGLFTGYFPVAPGTVGSLAALALYAWTPLGRPGILPAAIVVLFFMGVWAATETEKTHGHDAGLINVDEMAGMWISLLLLPPWFKGFWPLGAFLLFRFFDVVKPFPVQQAQKLPRGWGVMVDDVAAGLYANAVLRLIHWILIKITPMM
jgi:phosphatidylglycerophosphatase A